MLTGIPDEFVVGPGDSSLRLFHYFGSKARFKHVFDAVLPDEAERVVDVFGGSGAFSFYACRRYGAGKVVYSDASLHLANLMLHARDFPHELRAAACRHCARHSRGYYYRQREIDSREGVEGAGRLLYLARNSFSGILRIKDGAMGARRARTSSGPAGRAPPATPTWSGCCPCRG